MNSLITPDLPEPVPNRERGSALLIMLTIIGIGAAFLLVSALNKTNQKIERDKITSAALAQAKGALIGYAATYRDTHPNEVFGYLPLPDLGSSRNGYSIAEEGNAAGNFTGNATNMTVMGRLPWQTLGLPALRDSQGECLWLAVSGTYQNVQQTALMNWDTLGQFETFSSNGTPGGTINTIGTNYHQRPTAVIFAPGAVLIGQNRTTSVVDTVSECGGNYNARNYLDTLTANPLINSIVNYLTGINNATATFLFATPKQLVMGPVSDTTQNTLVNDRLLTITPEDLFRTIKRRSDFKTFVEEKLLNIAKNNLGLAFPAPATMDFTNPTPNESSGGATVGNLEIGRIPASALTTKALKNWQDNLLYARCTSGGNCLTVNGVSCRGMLIFAGERVSTQTRATNTQKNNWTNYLENPALAAFNAGATNFTGASTYTVATPSTDVLASITTVAATQKSFAADLGSDPGSSSFNIAGAGVTVNYTDKTVTVADDSTNTNGGCFWFHNTIPLAGKIVRSYYDYKFSTADTYALTGTGTDRGNGFTFQMVRSDIGAPTGICGREADMGALAPGLPVGLGDPWGLKSVIFETDVRRDIANTDPVENHTAIMAYGNLLHSAGNGNTTAACNGTVAGCRHNPANKFEESLSPLAHNQRIEIHTGCNSTCSTCVPTNHVTPNTYARITAWVDCTDCDDIIVDLDRVAKTPTIKRCFNLDTELNSVYFAFTGGFRSGTAQQGVTISNFQIRSE